MKAIAVTPGRPDSIHLRDVPMPSLADLPDGQRVLVKTLSVGVDGTDKEINAAEYGAPPAADDYLIIAHESFGVVEAVGANVTQFRPGDYVVASVRRPGSSLYDQIGLQDMTTDDTYFERGINLCHGYLSEYFVEDVEHLIWIPDNLKTVAVLMEPTSVAHKAINQAYEIQRWLRVWRPRRAAVLGVGTLGLLATLFLRPRGIEVVAMARTKPPFLNADLLAEIWARYISTKDTTLSRTMIVMDPPTIMGCRTLGCVAGELGGNKVEKMFAGFHSHMVRRHRGRENGRRVTPASTHSNDTATGLRRATAVRTG